MLEYITVYIIVRASGILYIYNNAILLLLQHNNDGNLSGF